MSKRKLFTVYKCVDPETYSYGSIHHMAHDGKTKVGDRLFGYECVLVTDNTAMIEQLYRSIPDDVYQNLAAFESTIGGILDNDLYEYNLRKFESLKTNKIK